MSKSLLKDADFLLKSSLNETGFLQFFLSFASRRHFSSTAFCASSVLSRFFIIASSCSRVLFSDANVS